MPHPCIRSSCHSHHRPSTVEPVARTPMRTCNFRAPGTVWLDAVATADAAGENLADRLREFLDWYSRQPHARPPRRPDHAVRHRDVTADA